MTIGEEKHDPSTLWEVVWFDRFRFWHVEVEASSESLARLMSKKVLCQAEFLREDTLTHISTKVLPESKSDIWIDHEERKIFRE